MPARPDGRGPPSRSAPGCRRPTGPPGSPPASSTRGRRRPRPRRCGWSAPRGRAGCCGRPSRRRSTRPPPTGCRCRRWRSSCRGWPRCGTTSSGSCATGASRRGWAAGSACSRRRSRWRSPTCSGSASSSRTPPAPSTTCWGGCGRRTAAPNRPRSTCSRPAPGAAASPPAAELMSRWEGIAIAPARRLVAAARRGPRAQLAAMVETRLGRAAPRGAPPTPSRRAPTFATAGRWRRWPASPRPWPMPARRGRGRRGPAPPRGPLPPGVVGELIADLTFVAREEPPGGLDVHDLASLRGSRYEVVVIAGLDGDGLPPAPPPDPLLGELREPLGDVLPARAPGTSESRLRFVHAVDAARSRLVLVRRTVDDEGRELAPSPYWLEACRVAGRRFDDLDRVTGARGEVPDSAAAARSERDALRAMALDGEVAPGLLAEAARRAGRGRSAWRRTPSATGRACASRSWRPSCAARTAGSATATFAPAELEELIDPRFEGTWPTGCSNGPTSGCATSAWAVRAGDARPLPVDARGNAPRGLRRGAPRGRGGGLRRPAGAAAAPPGGDAQPRGRARVGARAAVVRARDAGRGAAWPPRRRGSRSRGPSTASTSAATAQPWSSTTSGPAATSPPRPTT